ncbi:hypothetical protein TSAR_008404 [Trichomalopsis sarcophagae]|uniref:Uncharacterized protein n=1 Tax=Trichomalopsis sarcophagae TaxID=543379 RepID=A0A232EGC1_9HYME|nr:hypothetical protein TSAR_008404 [Trichomalopsis sarcophagae]
MEMLNVKVDNSEVVELLRKKLCSTWEHHDRLPNKQAVNDSSARCSELEQYLVLRRTSKTDNVYKYWKSVRTSMPCLTNCCQ